MIETLQADAQRLIQRLAQHRRLVVAFSGGVDSSLVLAAARQARLDFLVAVTADSPSVPRSQLELARNIATELSVEHVVIETNETSRAEYIKNDGSRCYFCKQTLYDTITQWIQQQTANRESPFASETVAIASGTNADDLGDYRPGIEAGREKGVLTPLADLGFDKSAVRRLAGELGLSNGDLPAAPCLASRIAYGVEVTPERLGRIELAEQWLRERGFAEVRVRLHADELGRIEVAPHELERMVTLNREGRLSSQFRQWGFRFVTVDLEGYQSGSLNRALVSIELPITPSRGERPASQVDRAAACGQGAPSRSEAMP